MEDFRLDRKDNGWDFGRTMVRRRKWPRRGIISVVAIALLAVVGLYLALPHILPSAITYAPNAKTEIDPKQDSQHLPATTALDFDCDGILDLAFDGANGIHVRRGNGVNGVGDGTFGPDEVIFPEEASPIAAGDFDNNGGTDIAVVGGQAGVVCY